MLAFFPIHQNKVSFKSALVHMAKGVEQRWQNGLG